MKTLKPGCRPWGSDFPGLGSPGQWHGAAPRDECAAKFMARGGFDKNRLQAKWFSSWWFYPHIGDCSASFRASYFRGLTAPEALPLGPQTGLRAAAAPPPRVPAGASRPPGRVERPLLPLPGAEPLRAGRPPRGPQRPFRRACWVPRGWHPPRPPPGGRRPWGAACRGAQAKLSAAACLRIPLASHKRFFSPSCRKGTAWVDEVQSV